MIPFFQPGPKWKNICQVPNPFGTSLAFFKTKTTNIILKGFAWVPLWNFVHHRAFVKFSLGSCYPINVPVPCVASPNSWGEGSGHYLRFFPYPDIPPYQFRTPHFVEVRLRGRPYNALAIKPTGVRGRSPDRCLARWGDQMFSKKLFLLNARFVEHRVRRTYSF